MHQQPVPFRHRKSGNGLHFCILSAVGFPIRHLSADWIYTIPGTALLCIILFLRFLAFFLIGTIRFILIPPVWQKSFFMFSLTLGLDICSLLYYSMATVMAAGIMVITMCTAVSSEAINAAAVGTDRSEGIVHLNEGEVRRVPQYKFLAEA